MSLLVNFPIFYIDDTSKEKVFCIKLRRNQYNILLNKIKNDHIWRYYIEMVEDINNNNSKIIYNLNKIDYDMFIPNLSIVSTLENVDLLISKPVMRLKKQIQSYLDKMNY